MASRSQLGGRENRGREGGAEGRDGDGVGRRGRGGERETKGGVEGKVTVESGEKRATEGERGRKSE